MTEYNLQILRSESPLADKEAAIALLNAYEHHHIGQPVAILYKETGNVRVLYAVGKKDSDQVSAGDTKCGPDFYEIINNGESFVEPNWEKVN